MNKKNPEKPTILIISNYHANSGGISGVVFNHLTKLREEGFIVTLFNTKRNHVARLFLVFKLLRIIREYSIIHIHGASFLGFYPIVIGIFSSKIVYNKRVVVTYHGGGAKDFLKRWSIFIKYFLKKADHVTVMSSFLETTFKSYGIKTVILPNLIEIPLNSHSTAIYDYPRLLSIRSLKKLYNIDDIIRAFVIVRKKYPNATLTIAGDGPEEMNLKNLSNQTNGIEFIGSIKNIDIPKIMMKNKKYSNSFRHTKNHNKLEV